MATLEQYREKIRYLTQNEVVQWRREIFQAINGDVFFPLKRWPLERRLLFWSKPIGNRQTFKLVLFLVGNGCPPDLICPWILLSQAWATPEKAEKRAGQVDFVLANMDSKMQTCFYLDMDYGKILFLNGLPKDVNTQN